jgi:hypothetical protein
MGDIPRIAHRSLGSCIVYDSCRDCPPRAARGPSLAVCVGRCTLRRSVQRVPDDGLGHHSHCMSLLPHISWINDGDLRSRDRIRFSIPFGEFITLPERNLMSARRKRMMEDGQLHGLSANTQETYVYAVRLFSEYVGHSLDKAMKAKASGCCDRSGSDYPLRGCRGVPT